MEIPVDARSIELGEAVDRVLFGDPWPEGVFMGRSANLAQASRPGVVSWNQGLAQWRTVCTGSEARVVERHARNGFDSDCNPGCSRSPQK